MKDCSKTIDKSLGWHFDNSYARLPDYFYAKGAPVPVAKPELVLLNNRLTEELGLSFASSSENALAQLFSGNVLPEGVKPLSQAYAGHQFGGFTMLGDGRAHLLGEHVTPDGKRFDIQLKGSGRTPFARRGDGRAALGPMLREYIISEAMHGLGIPTTRSLAVVKTGEPVLREHVLQGAILTRVASSHIRVGTFEYLAAREDSEGLKQLADYTIQRHCPDALDADNPYLAFLDAVIEKQIDLICHWLRVGFIHGVMNTDNMALSGETIDYGPCAFMDSYDPDAVFSFIDRQGRYAFGNQPLMAQWNLARFAETLLLLLSDNQDRAISLAETMIHGFKDRFKAAWLEMMRKKLGLFGALDDDEALIKSLQDWMLENKADYTNTFRALMRDEKPEGSPYHTVGFQNWYDRWQERLGKNTKPFKSSLCLMKQANPFVIPRNHKVEGALQAADSGDLTLLHCLLDAVTKPYELRDGLEAYTKPPTPQEEVRHTFCGT
jgi:uncharacterized protein YdiU (UPF0061 family)